MFIKKYINNISGLQLFQLLRFGTMLLISVVFAKSHLSTESIGNYELFIFITALFCSFWINSLIQAFLPLYRNNSTFQSTKRNSPEIFNAFILISFLSLITMIFLLIFKDSFAEILTPSDTIPYFELLLIYIFFSSPSFLIEYIYLLKNKPKSILMYGATTFIAQFLLVALPVVSGFGMEQAIIGLIIITVVRYIWLIYLLKKYSSFYISFKFIKEHIHYAWPLAVSTLVGSSASYVDGVLVLHYFDSSTFAIFRYGAKEFPLVLLMANALSTAMIPDFTNKIELAETLSNLKKRSTGLMHLLFPVTIVFLFFSQWLYPRIFNADFSESAVIFNIYLLLVISRLVFPHTILVGLKRTSIIMYASFVELIVNIILSLILINKWGIEGVAFATVIAFTVQKTIWLIYNKKVLNISPGEYISTKVLGLYSFMTLIIFLYMY